MLVVGDAPDATAPVWGGQGRSGPADARKLS